MSFLVFLADIVLRFISVDKPQAPISDVRAGHLKTPTLFSTNSPPPLSIPRDLQEPAPSCQEEAGQSELPPTDEKSVSAKNPPASFLLHPSIDAGPDVFCIIKQCDVTLLNVKISLG